MGKEVKANLKTIDLSKLQLRQIDGVVFEHDFSKELAQAIFSNTQNISEHAFSVDLFKNPIVELNDENKAIIKEYTEKYFKAFVQVAVNSLIEDKGE